jgi:hypothetical protein
VFSVRCSLALVAGVPTSISKLAFSSFDVTTVYLKVAPQAGIT